MQKIKITSTLRIDKPKALENIDMSYGISYVTLDSYKTKTIDQSNSWSMKILSRIDNFIQFFVKEDKKEEDKEVIEQIMSDTNFLSQYYKEQSKNLHVQINSETKITKIIKSLSESKNFSKHFGSMGLENDSAFFHLYDKKMFLGLDIFNKENENFKDFGKSFTRKEIVSMIFFHEYSHGIEFKNYNTLHTEKTNTLLDNLYKNLWLLSGNQNYENLGNLIQDSTKMPGTYLIESLRRLHQEMYADTYSLLLIRNKKLIENNFNEENFSNTVKNISQYRRMKKNKVRKMLDEMNIDITYYNHFTSPALDAIAKNLSIINDNKDKVLSLEDMHKVTHLCVQEGVAQTILTMIKAEPNILEQFKTILSISMDSSTLSIIANKESFDEAFKKLHEVATIEWQHSFDNNLKLLDHKSPANIFDAGVDNQSLYDKFPQYKTKINEQNNALVSEIEKPQIITTDKQIIPRYISEIRNKLRSNNEKPSLKI